MLFVKHSRTQVYRLFNGSRLSLGTFLQQYPVLPIRNYNGFS
jgi:hypothetical protein